MMKSLLQTLKALDDLVKKQDFAEIALMGKAGRA
jgi:hypothetical protein